MNGSTGPNAAKRIHVLAIDGGGVRGIIPAEILAYIEDKAGRPCCEMFDLIAGTSTGGIITLGVGTRCNNGGPYRAVDLSALYIERGAEIFPKPLLPSLKQVFGPKYSAGPLERILQEKFGSAMLSDALTPLIVCSYDIAGQIPFLFKSHRIAGDSSYNFPVRQAARATSAAPTYFPPLQMDADYRGKTHKLCLVDGGVFANNPAIAAYAEARSIYDGVPDSDFLIVSVGTGDRKDAINVSSAHGWGLLAWAKLLAPIFMDSVSEATDYEAFHILGERFHRFQYADLPEANKEMDNADPANLKSLQAEAQTYIKLNRQKLDALCAELAKGRGGKLDGIGRIIPA